MRPSQNRSRRPGPGTADIRSDDLEGSRGKYAQADQDASIPDKIVEEIRRLYRAGHSLLPIGGNEGKSPLVRYKDRAALPIDAVLHRMLAAGSRAFAVRLPGMLVVDVDADTPEARSYVRKGFGESTVQVRTRRGVHHYYRFSGKAPKNIRLPNIAIDFKAGPNEYVLAAASVRADGVEYIAIGEALCDVRALPEFVDRRPSEIPEAHPASGRASIPKGARNDQLFACAVAYTRTASTYEQLLADLLQMRTIMFDSPEDFSDAEVQKTARSAWGYREGNSLWEGRHSAMMLRRDIMDRVLARPNGCEAWSLYSLLQSNHGHIQGKRFKIASASMQKAGVLPLSRKLIIRARDILIEEGCLFRVGYEGRAVLYLLGWGHKVGGKDGGRV
ncbi:hypothetical protein [Mesorhizobium sp. M1365]|uniref:hypothetical protein n=1 Tax=Mesorhizobium sp. M1365 TaxID=2957090 RepID=UPI003338AB3E